MRQALVAAMLAFVCSVEGRGQDAPPPPAQEPTKPDLIGQAYGLLKAGRPREAQAAFRAILAAEPKSTAAREGLVWTALALGDPELAAREADERLSLAPGDSAWQEKRLSVLAMAPSRRREAIEGYRKLVASRPRDLQPLLRLAELLSWTPGRLSEAVAAYRRALTLAPKDYAVRLGLARTLAWSGMTIESARVFDALLADNRNDVDALLGRAQVARWTGDRSTARSLLGRALARKPKDARLHAELSRLELDAGRWGTARDEARAAVGLDPTLRDAREALDAIDEATRSRVGLKATYSAESTPFRRLVLGLPFEAFPLPDSRLRLETDLERFSSSGERLDRVSAGVEVRQTGFPWQTYLSLLYRIHLPEEVAATHEFGAELGANPFEGPVAVRGGWRQRAIVDSPVGYEDVAFLANVGSGGSTIVSIRERLQIYEGYLAISGSPLRGAYAYAEGTLGWVDDDNWRRTIAAGAGYDLLELAGGIKDHAVRLKYDYFSLSTSDETPLYFSPSNFQVSIPGLDWRWDPFERATVGLEGGLPINSDGSVGYLAGGFFSVETSDRVLIEGRARILDDTEFRVKAFTLGVALAF